MPLETTINIYTNVTGRQIFIDTSGFAGLYLEDDEFHDGAVRFISSLEPESISFVTTNFILDETYTLLKKRVGISKAVKFKDFLQNIENPVHLRKVLSVDEKNAWKYFVKLPRRCTSFTDCTCFAVMKRLGLKEVFTFDRGFKKAGFKVLP